MQTMIQKVLEANEEQKNNFQTCRNLTELKGAFGKKKGLIYNVVLRCQTAHSTQIGRNYSHCHPGRNTFPPANRE